MDTDHQLIVRLKAFINSSELINSPTAQELYNAYVELNNNAVQRLVECDVLLQKKQKIEAVVLAQQEPNLFDLIDSLLFPERKDLLILADLYDWPVPNEIKVESVANLRKAVSQMDDLRPLLTEFRRIARTDQVKNKLHLLREISRIDNANPEWRLPLTEVENQYVSQVIAEAQKAIQGKDFARLEQIHEELKNTDWVVTIPTIVLQKIDKIVTAHRAEEAKKGAAAILEKINDAFGAFDVIGLDDAMVCWNEHCKKYGYSPDANEAMQLKEATAYLLVEKKKQKAQQEFQILIEQISALMNSSAPLAEVEKYYAQAQASEFEIPTYISNRVAKYRLDIEKEHRASFIIKGLKIAGTAAVIILVISYAAFWGIQTIKEDDQAKTLYGFIRKGQIVQAQTLLKDIESHHPKLARGPKISRAKAELQNLIREEENRIEEFTRIMKEIDALRNQWPPDQSLKDKIAYLEKKAKTKLEKDRARQARAWIDDAFVRRANEVEDLFLKKVVSLKKYRDEVLSYINKNDFDQAEKSLRELEKIYKEISELREVNQERLAENRELLKSAETARVVLLSKKDKASEMTDGLAAIVDADNFASIESAIRSYGKLLDKDKNPDELEVVERWLKEISYFKAILSFQSGHRKSIPKEYAKLGYFQGISKTRLHEQKLASVKKLLISAFDSLQKNTNRQQINFLRVKSGNSTIDLYVSDRGISAMHEQNRSVIAMRRTDGTQVILKGYYRRLNMKIGDDEYFNCSLEYPKQFSIEAIRSSRAPHQVLIEKFFSESHSMNQSEAFRNGIKYLDEIRQNKMCAPYWKMKLSLRILEILTPLDLSPDKLLSDLKDELGKIQALDNAAGDPLDNKFLAEKITLFFKNYDFSVLSKALIQNETLQRFYASQKSYRFQCLGFALMINNNLKFGICANVKSVQTEVFCFDSEMSSFILVGRYDKNNLIINDKFQDKVAGHLLFTSEPADSLTKFYHDFINNKAELDLQKITWPDFWPKNMRGDAK